MKIIRFVNTFFSQGDEKNYDYILDDRFNGRHDTTACNGRVGTGQISHSNATANVTKKPNFYKRHRNLINIGIGTAAGALIGALVGGKKGALT